VPTLDETITVKIPRGTQPGQPIKVANKGVPFVQGYGRGDLVFVVNVEIPKKMTAEQERLLREFAACSNDNGRRLGIADKKKKKESWLDRIKDIALG